MVIRLTRPRENELGLFADRQCAGIKASGSHTPFACARDGIGAAKPRFGKKLFCAIKKFFAAHRVHRFVVASGNGRDISDAILRLHRIGHHHGPAGFLRNEAREFPNRRRDAGAAMRKHQGRIAVAEAFVAGCRRRRFNHVLGILLMRQYQKCVIPHRLQRRFIVLTNATFDLPG